MKNRIFIFYLLFLAGESLFAATAEDTWHLIYSSDFRAELKPCGCSESGDLGGILRRATKFGELRRAKRDTLIVSGGDILGDTDAQGRFKAAFMLEGQSLLKIDAIVPGERDLAHPLEVLENHALPWVLTNKSPDLPFAPAKTLHLPSGLTVFVYAVLDPAVLAPQQRGLLSEPASALREALTRDKRQTQDKVLLLAHGEAGFAARFAAWNLIDVVVRGHLHNTVKEAAKPGLSPVLATGYRGQHIGIAELDKAASMRLVTNRIVSLSAEIPDHPLLASLYERYNREIATWYRQTSAELKTVAGHISPYAGGKTCQTCHTQIYRDWLKTGHAQAMRSLREDGKAEDPECLACHTTGMGQSGGFISVQHSPDLLNVQCESCHGAGRKHAEYPLLHSGGKARRSCELCHTPENSPDFRPSSYWKKIEHVEQGKPPLHQQAISPIAGSYQLVQPLKTLVTREPIRYTGFFSFYCSSCYVLNAALSEIWESLSKPVEHREIPVVFSENQPIWPSLAYLAARGEGKGEEMKNLLFHAGFEQHIDISDRQTVLSLARQTGLENIVREAFDKPDSDAARQFAQGMALMKKYSIRRTPAAIINEHLHVNPSHSADNTNLMAENLRGILLDMQCRQYALCE